MLRIIYNAFTFIIIIMYNVSDEVYAHIIFLSHKLFIRVKMSSCLHLCLFIIIKAFSKEVSVCTGRTRRRRSPEKFNISRYRNLRLFIFLFIHYYYLSFPRIHLPSSAPPKKSIKPKHAHIGRARRTRIFQFKRIRRGVITTGNGHASIVDILLGVHFYTHKFFYEISTTCVRVVRSEPGRLKIRPRFYRIFAAVQSKNSEHP